MLAYSRAMKPMIDMLAESSAPDLREPGETGSPDSTDYESLGILKCVSAVHSILSSPKRGYEKCFRTAASERWPTDAEIDRVCEDIQLLVRAVLIASGLHTHKGQLRRRRYTQQVRRVRARRQSPGCGSQNQSQKPGQTRSRVAAQAASRQPLAMEVARRSCAESPLHAPAELPAQHRHQRGVKSRNTRTARSIALGPVGARKLKLCGQPYEVSPSECGSILLRPGRAPSTHVSRSRWS